MCDYRMYDRIWQRVSPELNPYPDVRGESSEVTLPETEIQFPSLRWRRSCPLFRKK